MPLEFESISHGKIAFGFFNIDTDMILLNQYFLFADEFCHSIVQAAEERNDYETSWEVYRIEYENIGNLMGAIDGVDHRGFIGGVYKLFPFPKEREEFKQKPEGFKNQSMIKELIQKYGKRISIPFALDQKGKKITIGEYVFSRTSFHELIKYVWRGGFPRWKDGIRPDYVLTMKVKIDQSQNPLFDVLILTNPPNPLY